MRLIVQKLVMFITKGPSSTTVRLAVLTCGAPVVGVELNPFVTEHIITQDLELKINLLDSIAQKLKIIGFANVNKLRIVRSVMEHII